MTIYETVSSILGLLVAFKKNEVKAEIQKPEVTSEVLIKKNKDIQAQRLNDPALNADVAFVTFLRFVSNMNKINPAQMDKYLTRQIGLQNPSDKAALIKQADALSSLGDAYQADSRRIAQDFTGIPSKEARKEQKKIALKKGGSIKFVEKSLRKSMSKDGWDALDHAIETRVAPNVTMTRDSRLKEEN
jgi:hypothetical protein